MFRSAAVNLKFEPKDGMKVMVFGTVSVFERDGVYPNLLQSNARRWNGSLYKAYEEMKARLEKKDYLSRAIKRKYQCFQNALGCLHLTQELL